MKAIVISSLAQKLPRIMRSLLRAASLLFVLFFVSATGLLAQSIRVLVATGEVTIQAPGDAAPRPAVKGDVVPVGSRLVTGPGARLVLTPFPGIKSMLAENSSLVVERAQSVAQSGSATLQQATLDLKTGVLVSDLEKQAGVAYDYSVKTPRGVAGARGTIYAVAIDVSGIESVLVSDGSIQITLSDGSSLVLAPGQASFTRPGQPAAAVSRLSDLSPSEQAILQAAMETTLETIAAAIEAGVDLQPDALQLTLQFAQDFGFVIAPDLLTSLQAALAAEDANEFGVMFEQIDTLPQNTTPDRTEVTEIITETVNDPAVDNRTDEERFADNLSPERKAAFLRRPSDIRTKLVQLNEPDYTNLVLDPDPITGLEYTDTQVRDALDNLAYLKAHDPAAFEFLTEVSGGAGLPQADTAPSPTEHSLASFQLMGETWSALSPDQQATLAELGAGESIMDTSASYLTALLATYEGLTTEQKDALSDTGWGAYLTDIAGESSLQAAVDTAATYTEEQRATIQSFGLSPYAFAGNRSSDGLLAGAAVTYEYDDPAAQLDALAALPSADQAILRRLGLKDRILNYSAGYYDGETYQYLTFAQRLELTLEFYQALSPEQQDLLISLDAGHWLFESAPSEYFSAGESSVTGLELAQAVLTQIASLSAARLEAAETLGLLDHVRLSDDRLNIATLTEALDAYLAAPAAVQSFIRDELTGTAVLDITVGSYSEYTVRPLSAIITLLSALTDAELDTLRDMGIGETLLLERFFPADFEGNNGEVLTVAATTETTTPAVTAGDQLKAMVNFYDGLADDQKRTLKELGILGEKDNFATFLSDFEGLDSLLGAYAALPGSIRAGTQRISNYGYYQSYHGRSFFIPRAEIYDYGSQLYYVSFTSDDDLYVGATRVLRITSGTSAEFDTFASTGTDPDGYALYLRAADLIELNDVRFSTNIRSITMEAATLNLYNIKFHDGQSIALNSKYGGTDASGEGSGPYPTFNRGNVFGRVNFINVSYGDHLLDGVSAFDAYGKNIAIGTLQNKAVPPTGTVVPGAFIRLNSQ